MMRRVVASFAVLLLALPALALPAQAHAELESMTPTIDSAVNSAPASISLTFSEEVQALGATVVVLDPAGNAVQQGEASAAGRTLSIALQPLTQPGTYRVNFRVVSADGHVVTGSERFTFSPSATDLTSGTGTGTYAASPAPEVSEVKSNSAKAAYWITAFLMLTGALVALGVWRARR